MMQSKSPDGNHPIYTVGYEGRTPDDVLSLLNSNNIEILLDVRIRPQSRKPGFSKRRLSELCEHSRISYKHMKELGTPREMMDRIKAGNGYDSDIFDEYKRYMLTQEESLESLALIATQNLTCLLCYELDANVCHRIIIAKEISKRLGGPIKNL